MTYQDLLKNGHKVTMNDKIEVVELDGIAYKLFDKSFSKNSIYYEAMLHSVAECAGISVPKIHGIVEVDERVAILTDFINGETVVQLMEENPGKKGDYLELLCDTQIDISNVVVSDVKKLKHKLAREIETAPFIDDIKKYELQTRLASMPEHNKFCHGNFGPENVMIDRHGKLFIIDWVAATRGNASADVAKTYLKLAVNSSENAEKYLALYCEKTGTAKNYINEWLPIVAAAQLNSKRLSEKEKTLMLTWLDVVDYE